MSTQRKKTSYVTYVRLSEATVSFSSLLYAVKGYYKDGAGTEVIRALESPYVRVDFRKDFTFGSAVASLV